MRDDLTKPISTRRGLLVLSPLLVFIFIYLATSLLAGDFYKVPLTVAFLIASIYAIIITGGNPLKSRIETYSRGAGSDNMMFMLWIFVLAGAFSGSASKLGAIDSTVNLVLSLLPSNMLMPALFIGTCLISFSVGTSVGTIVALVPIAVGMAEPTGINAAVLVGIVVGGAFFGDNLSFISDTTVAATSSQHCKMSDKFRVNLYLVLPAALVLLAYYIVVGINSSAEISAGEVNYLLVIPYFIVIVTAVMGMNVMAVLTLGLLTIGLLGICNGSYNIVTWMQAMGDGIMSMSELIIITMMAGGLLEIIKTNGGNHINIQELSSKTNGKRGAELSIVLLVALVNICTANNTVAIIAVGQIANRISCQYGIDRRKVASILDTTSCAVQGLLPYGAQVLMAAGLAAMSPVEIIPHLLYPMAIGLATILSILFRYPRKFS